MDLAFARPETRQRIMICQPYANDQAECARRIIGSFVRRAYRRPVGGDEVGRLVRFVEAARAQGESFERGIQLALQAALVSPHFLFRVELDPQPGNAKAVHPLTQYELANRLSYFLWSSMPDDPLFELARKGALRNRDVLAAQVRRMLKDPKARALGRGVEPSDRPAVDRIVAALARGGYKFSSLVQAVVESDCFQMRRGAGGVR